ncbi:hypothetical protein NXF25_002202 [Crotalus adamanteus]|uniref:Uncharacterized protein n=1 Tax=Crotalus adamanteus TaxID=8729 RepID=A0AAW1CB84_CROAD
MQRDLKNKKIRISLTTRCDLENKEITVVVELLKQKAVAISEKIK